MDVESNIILEIMKYFIVVVALIMAYAEIRQALKLKGSGYAWVKWCLGGAGIYWAVYYIRSILDLNLGPVHQIWVRSPLLLTLAFVAAGAILSLRRGRS